MRTADRLAQLRLYWLSFPILVLAATAAGVAQDRDSQRAADREDRYGKIELLRDRWGVPHVFAASDAGAMYGLGYATAQDRGFQMYYLLRIAQGRTSEFLGELDKTRRSSANPNTTLEHDRLMRTIGFAQAAGHVAQNLDSDALQLLEAYSAGVNDYFAQQAQHEHYLFTQTGLQREPWTPADCILSWWHFAQFFAANGLRDHPALTPPERVRARMPRVMVDDDAAVVRREDVTPEWIAEVDKWVQEMGFPQQDADSPDTPDPKFSHAWVIGGAKTTTGAAVLISDPQTPVWNPNMLYEFHAQGESFNARGIGVPGSPIILIGFNPHVAWGMTALGADQADLFLLDTDDEHPDQYRVDGQWLDMTQDKQVIHVRDADPVSITVRQTIFGPVVSEYVWQNPPDQQLALCRVPTCELDRETIVAAIGMMRARSCAEFAAALPDWRFPTANCVFGDSQGNIGYWSLGALPVRSLVTNCDGSHAQDGRRRDGMWRGMIPSNLLPHCLNPPRGYLVSANHRTIQSFYRVPFGNMTGSSGDTDRGLRIKERILEHLANTEQFTPEAVLDIQYDTVNVWKREIVRLGFQVLAEDPEALGGDARRSLEHLRGWYAGGCQMDWSIPGTELASEISIIFRGGVVDLAFKYGGGVSGLARFAKSVRVRNAADPSAPVPDDERQFVNLVLGQAWQCAAGMYGPDPQIWHALARQQVENQTLGYLESLDAFPALDEKQSVLVPRLTTTDGATILSQRAQAYTQFVPLHNADQAQTLLPIGNSDDPSSPYRFATYGDWSRGQLHPAPLSRAAVEKLAVAHEPVGPRRRAVRGAPQRPAQRGAASGPPRRGGAEADQPRPQLPGKKPDDPTLEAAIRYLNRPERTAQEVDNQINQLRDYVADNQQRKDELVAGLELFTYLMRQSQAGQLPITYGNPDTLRRVQALYEELGKDK